MNSLRGSGRVVKKIFSDYMEGLRFSLFVLERMNCTLEYIINFGFLNKNENEINDIFRLQEDILESLVDVEDKSILHRDLKSDNVFIAMREGKIVAKIGDFGNSRMHSCHQMSSVGGFTDTAPPEAMVGDRRYSYRFEVFSAGCLFASMMRAFLDPQPPTKKCQKRYDIFPKVPP
eukprot:899130_1